MKHMLLARRTMIFCGMWRLKLESPSTIKNTFYKAYSVLMHILLILYVLFQWIAVLSVKDLNKTMQGLALVLLVTILFIKAFILQKPNVTSIFRDIVQYDDDSINFESDRKKIYDSFSVYTKYVNIVLFWVSASTGITLLGGNFAIYLLSRINVAKNHLNETEINKPLPYVTWLPVNEEEHYLTAFAMHVFFIFLGCWYNSYTQIAPITIMTFILSQIAMLKERFSVYGSKCRNLPNLKDKENLLRSLIQDHQKLISYVHELDDAIKYVILLEFSTSALLLTAMMYQIMFFQIDLVFPHRIVYLFCCLLQMYVLAWHANEISIKSVEIGDAVYECEWYDLPETIKKELWLIIIRSQKALYLSVGPFFELRNGSAVNTSKAAYSYLMLLKNTTN